MAALYDALKHCVERLDRYARHGQRIGEQNTKASLIEPVIGALGWDVLDPDEVHREYRRRPSDNPVDYALLLLRTPRLFIEAKGLRENLDDPRWANQTISYAAVAGVEWVALTDGAEWRIFNAHAPVPVEQKLFRAVRIAEDIDEACEVLGLLGKEDMRDNRIQELWKGFFVDRQVHTALVELFNSAEPARDLVGLIGKRIPNLSRVEVRASLIRARASFDFPAATALPPARHLPPGSALLAPDSGPNSAAPTPTTAPPRAPAVKPTTRRRGSVRQSSSVGAAERAVRLQDLLRSGVLPPPATITADYLGQRYTGDIADDGTVRFNGTPHPSLSAAGTAVKIAARGPDAPATVLATDGWGFWKAEDPTTGRLVTLKDLRRRYADNS